MFAEILISLEESTTLYILYRLCGNPSDSVSHLPPTPPKKSLDLHESHGWSWAGLRRRALSVVKPLRGGQGRACRGGQAGQGRAGQGRGGEDPQFFFHNSNSGCKLINSM